MSFEPVEIEVAERQLVPGVYKNEYLFARALNIHRMSKAKEVKLAVNYLCDEIGYQTKKANVHMMVLVCDLYHNYIGSELRYLRLSMSKNDGKYTLVKRYNRLEINYYPLRCCMLGLIRNRYIFRKKGYFNEKFDDGYQTRIRARPKLIRLLEDKFGVSEPMIVEHPNQELIIQRSKSVDKTITYKNNKGKSRKYIVKTKRLTEYRDNDHTRRWRTSLEKYNELLNKTYIDIDLWLYKHKDEKVVDIDLSNKRVRRSFSNGVLVLGGRFYGGWWQRLSEKLRERIIIDGHHVCEIDYSGIMVHILYAIKGLKLKDFNRVPYLVSKNSEFKYKREYYKKLMNVAININEEELDEEKDFKECVIHTVYYDTLNNPYKYEKIYTSKRNLKKTLRNMFDEMISYHDEIKEFFGSGEGLRTQFHDSQIAYRIITKMTKLNIPVLCVHDSFLCSEKHYKTLKHLMYESYVDELNQVQRKYKYESSYTVEDVETTESNIDYVFPAYMRMFRNSWFNMFNYVFANKNEQYARQKMFLTKRIVNFNKTIKLEKTS